jgi:hypothetical protein
MKFRKKPVVIEAHQITAETIAILRDWINAERPPFDDQAIVGAHGDTISIPTLEGRMAGHVGDWIIRGVKGEFYPCKPDIFAATYQPADERPVSLAEDPRRVEAAAIASWDLHADIKWGPVLPKDKAFYLRSASAALRAAEGVTP